MDVCADKIQIALKNLKFDLILIIILFLSSISFGAFAQQRLIIPLTEHYTAADSGAKNHVYNNLVTVTPKGELYERFYDLNNRLVKSSKSSFKDPELQELVWKETQYFDKKGELEYAQIYEIYDNAITTKIADAEQLILDIICTDIYNCVGDFTPKGKEGPISVKRNVFEANFENPDEWTQFMVENVRYPTAAKKGNYQGIVQLALKIDSNGALLTTAPVNPKEVHKSLVEELQRVVLLNPGPYLPAMNKYGEAVEGWIYFSFDFTF